MSLFYEDIVAATFNGKFDIKLEEDVLTEATMTKIMKLIEKASLLTPAEGGFQRSTVVNTAGKEIIDESRTSESIAVPTRDGLADAIRMEIATKIFSQPKLARAVCPGDDRFLQIQRYDKRGHFDLHHDSVAADPVPKTPVAYGDRVLTVFVYLNDGFAGGRTQFPGVDRAVVPKRNKAAAWPNYIVDGETLVPDEKALHQADPIEERNGVKYKYGMNVWFCLTEGVLESSTLAAAKRKRQREVTILKPRSVATKTAVSMLEMLFSRER